MLEFSDSFLAYAKTARLYTASKVTQTASVVGETLIKSGVNHISGAVVSGVNYVTGKASDLGKKVSDISSSVLVKAGHSLLGSKVSEQPLLPNSQQKPSVLIEQKKDTKCAKKRKKKVKGAR